MNAYEIHDGRYLQVAQSTSAANGHSVGIGPVPAGKVWTVLSAFGLTSADDTQDYWFSIYIPQVLGYFPVTRPVEHVFDVSESNWFPMLTEGMEMKLWPDDKLYFMRDGAVAGSTISVIVRYIETDLPYYKYTEPLKRVAETARRHGSTFRSTGGVTPGSSPGGGPGPVDHGGGGGGAEPV